MKRERSVGEGGLDLRISDVKIGEWIRALIENRERQSAMAFSLP